MAGEPTPSEQASEKSPAPNPRAELAQEVSAGVQESQKQKILDQLRSATGAEQRVRVFGALVDDYGIDPILSAVIPEAGDAGVSVVAGLYLLSEAKRQGLGTISYLKIISLQAADFAIGAIPIAGDIADFLFKATKWSVGDFEKNKQKLILEARRAGVPEEDIAKISQSGEKITSIVSKAVYVGGTVKKGLKQSAESSGQAEAGKN